MTPEKADNVRQWARGRFSSDVPFELIADAYDSEATNLAARKTARPSTPAPTPAPMPPPAPMTTTHAAPPAVVRPDAEIWPHRSASYVGERCSCPRCDARRQRRAAIRNDPRRLTNAELVAFAADRARLTLEAL